MNEEIIENKIKTKEVIYQEAQNNSMKETMITLNTLNTGTAEGVSDIVTGELQCIVIDSNKPVQVMIVLEEYPSITLFSSSNENISTAYLALRTMAINPKNERFTFTDAKWMLNNKLRCMIMGTQNTTTKILVRYR